MSLNLRLAVELGEDRLGENFTELDSLLVERVDSPNATLNEDLVFVHDDEGSESLGSQLLEEYRVGRSVSFENL